MRRDLAFVDGRSRIRHVGENSYPELEDLVPLLAMASTAVQIEEDRLFFMSTYSQNTSIMCSRDHWTSLEIERSVQRVWKLQNQKSMIQWRLSFKLLQPSLLCIPSCRWLFIDGLWFAVNEHVACMEFH